MDMNYYESFIAVADDCRVSESVVPTACGDRKTVAVLQYEMLAADPWAHAGRRAVRDLAAASGAPGPGSR